MVRLIDVVPVILAAGESRRMGPLGPKALCRIGNLSLIEHIIGQYRRAGTAKPIVVLGCRAAQIRALAALKKARIVVNRRYRSGRTSSFQSAVRAVDAVAWFLHPVDVPLAGVDAVRRLLRAFREERGADKIFLPSFRKRCGHPALIDASLKSEILAMKPDDPLRDLIFRDRERIRFVPVRSRGILLDVDTPDDLRTLQRYYRKRGKTLATASAIE